MKTMIQGAALGIIFGLIMMLVHNALDNASKIPTPEPLAITVRKNTLFVKSENARASAVYLKGNLVLTARHVCQGMPGLYLVDYAKRGYKVVRLVKASNPQVDLCLLVIEPMKGEIDLPGTRIPAGYQSEVGDRVYVGGFGGGVYYSFKTGLVYSNEVIQVDEVPVPFRLNLIDVPIIPGNSGGGAFTENGSLVGIVSAGNGQFGALVPVNAINDFLDTLDLGKLAGARE